MTKQDRQQSFRRAYQFLKSKDVPGITFTYEELTDATGWGQKSIGTYLGKWLGEVVERRPSGRLAVLPRFWRYTEQRFIDLATQKRRPRANYNRFRCSEIVNYEFLLPLTREDELRRTLDSLFYADTIENRLREVGLGAVARYVIRNPGESDSDYIDRIRGLVSDFFAGYSISHVSGRFRAADIVSRQEAVKILAADGRYLIDETTASVRFIVPLLATKADGHELVDDYFQGSDLPSEAVQEILMVHGLFFDFFVEAIVELVNGEDAIWLVEESGSKRTLYMWEKV